MAWDKGFNFRLSSSYVTDIAPSTYVETVDLYPTTRNNVVFGWDNVTPGNGADRSTGIDTRLAGLHFMNNTTCTFRVDLPSDGWYAIHLAQGDYGGGGFGAPQTVTLLDSNTPIMTYASRLYNVSDQFSDAHDQLFTAATWPGSEVPLVRYFTSLQFRLTIVSSGYWTLSHLSLSLLDSAPVSTRLSYAAFPPVRRS
jgi:hypothetical protein